MPAFLKGLSNVFKPNSIANRFRRKRFSFFLKLVQPLPPPVRVLDAGGTPEFWEQMGIVPGLSVVLLNVKERQTSLPNLTCVVGDATEMSLFQDKEFDVAFSNSVIEHVGDRARQAKMAREIMRVGTRYFVQTPNYYFPIEPHFLFPFFQFLPVACKAFLLHHFAMGWVYKRSTKEAAREAAMDVHLLTRKALRDLFPSAKIYKEKVLGLTKSLVAYGGW